MTVLRFYEAVYVVYVAAAVVVVVVVVASWFHNFTNRNTSNK
jgi:hypothetical protein